MGVAMGNALIECLKKHEVDPEKVAGITQDNASNCHALSENIGGMTNQIFSSIAFYTYSILLRKLSCVFTKNLQKQKRKCMYRMNTLMISLDLKCQIVLTIPIGLKKRADLLKKS